MEWHLRPCCGNRYIEESVVVKHTPGTTVAGFNTWSLQAWYIWC